MKVNKYLKIGLLGALCGSVGYVVYRSWKAYKEENAKDPVVLDVKVEDKDVTNAEVVDEPEQSDGIVKFDINKNQQRPYDLEVEVEDYTDLEVLDTIKMDEDGKDAWTGIMIEGMDEELKHDKDSIEAWNQYVDMMLSDFQSYATSADVLDRLFNITFAPVNKDDGLALSHIIDERRRFFGPDSKYSKYGSFAELLIYFANKMNWNYDVGLEDAMKFLIENLEIDPSVGDTRLGNTCADLKDHNFVNSKERYGLFGLTTDDYDFRLCKYPSVVVRSNDDITFYMEFNVWANEHSDTFYEGML